MADSILSNPALNEKRARVLKAWVSVVLGSLALTLSAKLVLPLWPVSGTLQTLLLPLFGVFLGPRLGAATVAFYLFQGAIGLPVFTGTPAHGLGLPYMMGGTAGFLLGFVPATYLMGYFYEQGACQSFAGTLRAVVLSSLVVIIPGLAWVAYLFGVSTAFINGLGLIPGSLAKTGLAAAAIYKFAQR